MASRFVTKISKEEAEQQFDLLFDEFFKDENAFLNQGRDRLESGSAGEECDEVYIPEERQDPEQVAQRQAICEVARELQSLGDHFSEKYGRSLEVADTSLSSLFTQMTSLEYNTFKNTVESLTTTDRNTADFIFMMCLSRNVVSHVGNAANKAKNFFRRYISANYIPKLADAGGVREFVQP